MKELVQGLSENVKAAEGAFDVPLLIHTGTTGGLRKKYAPVRKNMI